MFSRRLQLLDLVNIGRHALMQLVRIAITQMLAHLDRDLAKQRQRVCQRIPVICYSRTGKGLLHLWPYVRW